MAIVQSINSVYEFREAFRLAGRMNNFSYKGLEVLFDYLDNLSEDIGEPIELDVIALCCDYNEDTVDDIIANYSIEIDLDSASDAQDQDEVEEIKREAVKEYLECNTSVCGETADGFVYATFYGNSPC